MGDLAIIDITTESDPNHFVGVCVGGPFAGQTFTHFESTMAVYHEMNGCIGHYGFVAGAWRWSPIGPQHFNCRCTVGPIDLDLMSEIV